VYNTYQNRVATARESYNKAVLNYDNGIKEAQLQNNSILAEIAYNALRTQLELDLQGFQYKNTLLTDRLNRQQALDTEYYGRYRDLYTQAEQVRQYNENLKEQQRQYNTTMAFQKQQAKQQQKNWEKEYALSLRAASGRSSGGSRSGGSSGGSAKLTTTKNTKNTKLSSYAQGLVDKANKFLKSKASNLFSDEYKKNYALNLINAARGSNKITDNDVTKLVDLIDVKISQKELNRLLGKK
jgi:hypothetical protein